LLQSNELQKGQLKGDVHELITTCNISLTFNFPKMGDSLTWLEEQTIWQKMIISSTQPSSLLMVVATKQTCFYFCKRNEKII
jgi:hypothetical protein